MANSEGAMQTTLAQLRRRVQRYMLDEIELLNGERSLDRYGRETMGFTVTATTNGQFSNLSGQERKLLEALVDSGVERMETARLALPIDVTPTPGQYVRKAGTSKVWNIRHVSHEETLGAQTVLLLTREVPSDEP